MTIRPGEDWGSASTVPFECPLLSDDAAVARSTGHVRLSGGDIHRSLGSPSPPRGGQPCTALPVDLLVVEVAMYDGCTRRLRAGSSVVIGRWMSRRRWLGVLNTGFLGRFNLAPRAHPNDGEFEVVQIDAAMQLRQRREARRRSITGSHIPHPHVNVTRKTRVHVEREGWADVLRIDGIRQKRWCSVTVSIEPDALIVCV